VAEDHRADLLALLQQFTAATERYVDVASTQDALHRTDLNALGILVGAAHSGMTVTPGMLREELNLSSPATTALIDRLTTAGHVTRTRSDVDRRQVHLHMTEKAQAAGARLFAPLAQHISQALDRFTEDELALLKTMLESVTEATITAKNDAAKLAGHSGDTSLEP
jgi:DNA-binding MarR family transcriptional regulator